MRPLLYAIPFILVLVAGAALMLAPLLSSPKTTKERDQRFIESFRQIEIHGCEYIFFSKYRMFGVAHKGTCPNH